MKVRHILKVIDRLQTQERIVLQMECGHNLSIEGEEAVAVLTDLKEQSRAILGKVDWSKSTEPKMAKGLTFECNFCPDDAASSDPTEEFNKLFKE